MRSLWEAVAKRGEKRKVNGSEWKVGLERAKYMEFQHGGHSEFVFAYLPLALLGTDLVDFVDDTCTQPGYWSAIADFIASLGDVRKDSELMSPATPTNTS